MYRAVTIKIFDKYIQHVVLFNVEAEDEEYQSKEGGDGHQDGEQKSHEHDGETVWQKISPVEVPVICPLFQLFTVVSFHDQFVDGVWPIIQLHAVGEEGGLHHVREEESGHVTDVVARLFENLDDEFTGLLGPPVLD